MANFGMQKAGLALCLMAFMFAGHVFSACLCSHHQGKKPNKTDCHSQHKSTENSERVGASSVLNDPCICIGNQSLPYVTSKTSTRELASNQACAASGTLLDPDFVPADIDRVASPAFPNTLLYSSILRGQLRPRAPPRL
jgi:hypothetical protein